MKADSPASLLCLSVQKQTQDLFSLALKNPVLFLSIIQFLFVTEMTQIAVSYPTKTAKHHMARSRHSANRYYCYDLLVFPFFDKNLVQEKAKYSQLSVRQTGIKFQEFLT